MANQPKKYKRFVATAATATLVASAIVPVASAASFSDVTEGNSHQVAIEALVEQGIINGFSDGTFKPNQELTRGQVVKMLGRWVEAQGFEIPSDYNAVQRFNDVSVNAQDQELVKYAALVKDAGVFIGSNGSLNPAGAITRENMALTLNRAYDAVFGLSLVGMADGSENLLVADLSTAREETREEIQALRNLGISVVDNFNPKSTVTRGQFASFLNRTINVEAAPVELTVENAEVVNATTLNVTLSDDSTHVVTLATALEANKETNVTFEIEGTEYSATVTYVVEEGIVNSVKALNAKQVAVKFNKAVQEGTATGGAQILTNYSVDGVNPTRISLNADKTEATLTFAAGFVGSLDKYVEVIVKDVKDTEGKKIADYKAPVLLEDKTAPTASASYKAPTVTVDFSEALEIDATELGSNGTTKATVAVDGVPTTSYTIQNDNTASDALTGAKSIKLTGLTAGKHTISIVGAQDLAGNYLPDYSVEINVAEDTTAPSVTSLTAEGNNIRVKFSEPVVDTTLNSQANKRVWLTDGTVNVYADATDAVNDEGTEYLVDASAFVTSGSWKNVSVIVKAGSIDSSGNALASDTTAKNFVISKDTTKPSVVSTTTKDDKIIVKFDEAIQAGSTAITTLDLQFTDAEGVVVEDAAATQSALAYAYDANNDGDTSDAGEDQYLVITVNDADFISNGKFKVGSYSIDLAAQFVKDKAVTPNEAAATTITFNVAGTTTTTNNLTATATQATVGVLQFAFDAELTEAALNRNNFTMNGAVLPEGTKLYFYGNKQTVKAELPAGTVAVSGNRTLAVKNIVDKNGNTLDAASLAGTIVALTENTKPVAQTATLQNDKVVYVEFSEALANPTTASGIEVYVNGAKVDEATNDLTFAMANGTVGTNTRLTITATNADTFAPGQTIVVKFVSGSNVQDTNGNTVAASQVTVK